MWLKLEFPLAGEAEKQENRGTTKRERERERPTNSSPFTQAEGLLAHRYVLLSPLHSLASSQAAGGHTRTADTTRQLQGEITAWGGGAPGPFEKSVSARL